MIRRIVDFALDQKLLVLAFTLLLIAAGAVAFHRLPVDAYPDVADNYVEVITQWPGISAEQVEQQVTVPLETVLNGIPHVVHLRSFSIFGLSDIKLIFDDESSNDWNRERVLERLSQVTLPPGVTPQMGTDWSPVGQIYFFTLHSTNPQYDVMELKSLEDWVVEKNLKAVPDIVDVSSFGGPTREYQVRVDPNKLIAYGLSLAQVEQQLTNNNTNAGGSFVEAGLQQINVREVGLVRNVSDIENTVILTKNGTPIRVKDIAVVAQGPKIRLGQFAGAIHREDGKIVDNDDVVSGMVPMRKGADAEEALQGLEAKVKEMNDHILPPGVKIVPFIDRSTLIHFTTHTVMHNLTEGFILVTLVLLLLLGNVRGALIVALTIPFSLSVRLDLSGPASYPGQSALARGARFRNGGGRRGGDGGKHHPPHWPGPREDARGRQDTRCRARSAEAGLLRHHHHHHRLSSHLHPAAGGRPVVPSHGLDGRLCPAGRGDLLDDDRARCWRVFSSAKKSRDWHNPVLVWLTRALPPSALLDRSIIAGSMVVVAIAAIGISGYLTLTDAIGSEFLPHLDEGAIWVRGTLAPSTGPTEGIRVMNQARIMLCFLSRGHRSATSQVGRPDDGTDTTGFFNTEFFVGPEAERTVASGLSRETKTS